MSFLKYKLKGNNNILFPIETVLHNRGIKDADGFLKAVNNPNSEHHYSELTNINKAVNKLMEHINSENKSKIFFQIDPDADGYLSSAIMIDYLYKINPNLDITWRHQEGKEHGINSNHVPNGVNLVIVPDAGSSDFTEHKKLYKRGIDVVVIDHHEVKNNKESEYAIVVNNQFGKYPNRFLSGVGVVYKVLQALDDRIKVNYSKDYIDLVAIGIVADMMQLNSKENIYYVTKGLNNVKNPLIKYLLSQQPYVNMNHIVPNTVSFNIAPFINSVIRAGTMEEKKHFFDSIMSTDEHTIKETIEMMKDIKEKQDNIVNKSVEEINLKIKEGNLLKNKILIADVTGILDKNYTGLAANKISNSDSVKRPTLLLRYNKEDDTFSGSARGYEKGYIKDFKNFLLETGYFKYCEGHQNAFGVALPKNNLENLNAHINNELKDISVDTSEYIVDFSVNSNNINYSFVHAIDQHNYLWGKGIEEPLIVIKKIEIERRNIQVIGSKKNTIKFSHKEIDYIKFRVNEDEIFKLTDGNPTEVLILNVIGKANINKFRGRKTAQIIVEEIEKEGVRELKLAF